MKNKSFEVKKYVLDKLKENFLEELLESKKVKNILKNKNIENEEIKILSQYDPFLFNLNKEDLFEHESFFFEWILKNKKDVLKLKTDVVRGALRFFFKNKNNFKDQDIFNYSVSAVFDLFLTFEEKFNLNNFLNNKNLNENSLIKFKRKKFKELFETDSLEELFLENDLCLLLNGCDFKIYDALTYKGSCVLGYGNDWCVSKVDIGRDNFFNLYFEQGPIFFFLNKKTKNPKDSFVFALHQIDDDFIYEVEGSNGKIDFVDFYLGHPDFKSFFQNLHKNKFVSVRKETNYLKYFSNKIFCFDNREQIDDFLFWDSIKKFNLKIEKENDSLIVFGNLDLMLSEINFLPKNLKRIKGDLLLTKSKIKKLPLNLIVDGTLNILNCEQLDFESSEVVAKKIISN